MCKRAGRGPLTEIPLPRSARQRTVCLISVRGRARKARIEKFELDEGFQPYHPPFRNAANRPRWPILLRLTLRTGYYTIIYDDMIYYSILQYTIVYYYTILYDTIRYYTIPYEYHPPFRTFFGILPRKPVCPLFFTQVYSL